MLSDDPLSPARPGPIPSKAEMYASIGLIPWREGNNCTYAFPESFNMDTGANPQSVLQLVDLGERLQHEMTMQELIEEDDDSDSYSFLDIDTDTDSDYVTAPETPHTLELDSTPPRNAVPDLVFDSPSEPGSVSEPNAQRDAQRAAAQAAREAAIYTANAAAVLARQRRDVLNNLEWSISHPHNPIVIPILSAEQRAALDQIPADDEYLRGMVQSHLNHEYAVSNHISRRIQDLRAVIGSFVVAREELLREKVIAVSEIDLLYSAVTRKLSLEVRLDWKIWRSAEGQRGQVLRLWEMGGVLAKERVRGLITGMDDAGRVDWMVECMGHVAGDVVDWRDWMFEDGINLARAGRCARMWCETALKPWQRTSGRFWDRVQEEVGEEGKTKEVQMIVGVLRRRMRKMIDGDGHLLHWRASVYSERPLYQQSWGHYLLHGSR